MGQTVVVSGPPRRSKSNSAPYKRDTYFAELQSQWRQQEPVIPHKHYERIADAICHVRYDGPFDKQFVSEVLGFVDDARVKRGRRRKYKKKYFEKWRTIRYYFSGIKSQGVDAPEWVCLRQKELFKQINHAFRMINDTKRTSMISYPFVFRRINDLLRASHYNVDFPPLKSPGKRKNVVWWWCQIIRYLRWPYINTDSTKFGYIYKVNPVQVIDGRSGNAGRRAGGAVGKRKRFDSRTAEHQHGVDGEEETEDSDHGEPRKKPSDGGGGGEAEPDAGARVGLQHGGAEDSESEASLLSSESSVFDFLDSYDRLIRRLGYEPYHADLDGEWYDRV